MNHSYLQLSLDQIQELYNKAKTDLEQSLIDGVTWEEVKAKRDVVTALAREIWFKRKFLFNDVTDPNTSSDV